jgi:thiamine biosynthesis protein ThiS
MSGGITIVINGEKCEVPAGTTVAGLLDQLGITAGRVAVERNLEILPRARWEETTVQAGDGYEIVHLVGGG